MKIVDLHCDVLSKLLEKPQLRFDESASGLDVTLPALRTNGYLLQTFAVYLSETSRRVNLESLFHSIELFYSRILSHHEMAAVRTSEDFMKAHHSGRTGALLSLEGVDALNGNLFLLRVLFELGVRMVGLTWNHANWAADGVLEPRQGGLTRLGKRFVKECNQLGMLLDVSHLSEAGFWELSELTERPFLASHSNAYTVCANPRNLKDDQIRTIIEKNGLIGLTFVPYFVAASETVTPDRLLLHIDHVCSLGGVDQVAFGSDFDGIDKWISGLESAAQYDRWANILLKHYREDEAERFLWKNAYRFLARELPSDVNNGEKNGQ